MFHHPNNERTKKKKSYRYWQRGLQLWSNNTHLAESYANDRGSAPPGGSGQVCSGRVQSQARPLDKLGQCGEEKNRLE